MCLYLMALHLFILALRQNWQIFFHIKVQKSHNRILFIHPLYNNIWVISTSSIKVPCILVIICFDWKFIWWINTYMTKNHFLKIKVFVWYHLFMSLFLLGSILGPTFRNMDSSWGQKVFTPKFTKEDTFSFICLYNNLFQFSIVN